MRLVCCESGPVTGLVFELLEASSGETVRQVILGREFTATSMIFIPRIILYPWLIGTTR
jgi:hypothetical protein